MPYVRPDNELAAIFGVDRTAVYKARQKLGIDLYETERGRYRADSKTFISNIAVSQSEALVLYLATRRLSRNTRLAKQPVQKALGKLALALYKPMTEKLVKAAAATPEHPDEAKRVELLTELIRAGVKRAQSGLNIGLWRVEKRFGMRSALT